MLRGNCLCPAASAGQVQPIGCPAYEVGAEPAAAVRCAAAVCVRHFSRTGAARMVLCRQDRCKISNACQQQQRAIHSCRLCARMLCIIVHPLDESTAPRAFACEQMLRSRAASGLGSPRVCCVGQASVVWSPFIALSRTVTFMPHVTWLPDHASCFHVCLAHRYLPAVLEPGLLLISACGAVGLSMRNKRAERGVGWPHAIRMPTGCCA